MTSKKKVFICHSSSDKWFVRQMEANLHANGIRTWLDEREILVGDSIRNSISRALNKSVFVIAVLSKNSVKSTWVNQELNAALSLEIEKRRKLILPITLDLLPANLPVFLKDRLCADFNGDRNYALRLLLKAILKRRVARSPYWIDIAHYDEDAPGYAIRWLVSIHESLNTRGEFQIRHEITTRGAYEAELIHDDFESFYHGLTDHGLIEYSMSEAHDGPGHDLVVGGRLTKKGLHILRRHIMANRIDERILK